MTTSPPSAFVHWFRAAAPYIHAFRGKIFVIAFGGEVLSDGQFTRLAHDLDLYPHFPYRLFDASQCGIVGNAQPVGVTDHRIALSQVLLHLRAYAVH